MSEETTKPEVKHKVNPAHLERLADWMRRNNRPQSLKALTRRYIELLKEAAGTK
jgi:hypothetical protein